jgi:hypothetical protein
MEHLAPLAEHFGLVFDQEYIDWFVSLFQGERFEDYIETDIEYWEKLGLMVFREALGTISNNVCEGKIELYFGHNNLDVQVIEKKW